MEEYRKHAAQCASRIDALVLRVTRVEAMPSVTVGLYTRAHTPLTRVAAAMMRQVTAGGH